MNDLTQEEIERFLEHSDAFRELPADARKVLAGKTKVLTYRPQASVIQRGQIGNSLLVVALGSVRVALDTPKGEIELSTLKAGDFLGEIALFTQSKRTANVTATTETVLLEFHHDDVLPLIQRYPAFKTCLTRAGAQRSWQSLEKIEQG